MSRDLCRGLVRSVVVILAAAMGCGVAEAGSAALVGVTPLIAASLQARDHQKVADRAIEAPEVVTAPTARPRILVPLYCTFAALQIADAQSTYAAVQRGIGESNPLMMGVARSPAGLATAKLATTAATVAATELLWRHNRKAAIVTTIALKIAYAAVVAHNYRVVR
jgi:hypothetical protein